MKKLMIVLLLSVSASAMATDFSTTVAKVHDGDTFTVSLTDVYTGKQEHVRINHTDTPEFGGRAKCDIERNKAALAQKHLADMILNKVVILRDVQRDKYGRLLATVFVNQDGKEIDVGQDMLTNGYAINYEGKTKQSWCN